MFDHIVYGGIDHISERDFGDLSIFIDWKNGESYFITAEYIETFKSFQTQKCRLRTTKQGEEHVFD